MSKKHKKKLQHCIYQTLGTGCAVVVDGGGEPSVLLHPANLAALLFSDPDPSTSGWSRTPNAGGDTSEALLLFDLPFSEAALLFPFVSSTLLLVLSLICGRLFSDRLFSLFPR